MHTHVKCFHNVFDNPLVSDRKDFQVSDRKEPTENKQVESRSPPGEKNRPIAKSMTAEINRHKKQQEERSKKSI